MKKTLSLLALLMSVLFTFNSNAFASYQHIESKVGSELNAATTKYVTVEKKFNNKDDQPLPDKIFYSEGNYGGYLTLDTYYKSNTGAWYGVYKGYLTYGLFMSSLDNKLEQ